MVIQNGLFEWMVVSVIIDALIIYQYDNHYEETVSRHCKADAESRYSPR